jgi:hypothetical protein
MFFDHQVAGHKDQLFFYPEDKSKLIKSCNSFEIKFYSDVQQLDLSLKSFFPCLHEIRDDGIVMSNLSYNFKRPNIIDIKLGTKLFDRFASEEKINRMQNVANTTTSGSLGFRICGMKVWLFS